MTDCESEGQVEGSEPGGSFDDPPLVVRWMTIVEERETDGKTLGQGQMRWAGSTRSVGGKTESLGDR